MSLILKDVRYAYSAGSPLEQHALQGAGLDVSRGELVLVVGTTGSGKSTLLRVAAGLLEPQAGEASVDSRPLTAHEARGTIGLVFQNPESQLFAETLIDDVMFGPRNLGRDAEESRRLAEDALRCVGLEPDRFAQRSPFALSGGEARRAAFAGVLAMQPSYLLADEPTAGLDARGRSAIRDLLREARRNAGVVVVTHTAEEFLGDADRVVVLADGRVHWAGPADALIADPSLLHGAGLSAPAVLQVQLAARRRGLAIDGFAMDPAIAARRLAQAGGWL